MYNLTAQNVVDISNEISKYIAKPYTKASITISAKSFVEDTENLVEDYPYKAKYLDAAIMETDKIISFEVDNPIIYDSVGLVDGGFYLFASELPTEDITIRNVVMIRNAGGDWMKTVDIEDEFKESVAYKTDLIDEYSLEETKTNKVWLGKPVYRQVVDCGYLTNVGDNTATYDCSNKYFIRVEHSVYGANLYAYGPSFSTDDVSTYIDFQANTIYIKTSRARPNDRVYVILEYTKTTD